MAFSLKDLSTGRVSRCRVVAGGAGLDWTGLDSTGLWSGAEPSMNANI